MSFVERVNQGESLASWLNWLTEPPAVSRSVIMGHLTAIWKGEIWALPNAFRTGPGSCAVHSMICRTICNNEMETIFAKYIFGVLKDKHFSQSRVKRKAFFRCWRWWIAIKISWNIWTTSKIYILIYESTYNFFSFVKMVLEMSTCWWQFWLASLS